MTTTNNTTPPMDKTDKYFSEISKWQIQENLEAFKEKIMGITHFPPHTVKMKYDIPDRTHRPKIDDISISEDILKSTRLNPLFSELNMNTASEMKQYVDQNKVKLEQILEQHQRMQQAKKRGKRSTFDNNTKKKLKQEAIDKAPKKIRIYKAAYKIIADSDKSLSYYFNPKDKNGINNVSSKLWGKVKTRTGLSDGSIRHHLTKAYNEGIDPNLPGIKEKFVDGLLLDMLLEIGFSTKPVSH